ncbi:MAG: hypothetical protein J7K81_07205, partial [Methanophagales archaeon]|nr:hypothetical protein [Methanophagales archaeon]
KKEDTFDQTIKDSYTVFPLNGLKLLEWGSIIRGEVPDIFPAMAVVSGVFLVARELYKDGFVWLRVNEGVLTMVKVVLLVVTVGFIGYVVVFLSVVMLCGLLSSHLPEEVRERRFL